MATLDVPAVRTQLDAALRAAGTPERAAKEKRYLKSDLRHYGASMPVIHRVTRAFSGAHPELTREDLHDLVGALWRTEVHELRMAAVELMAFATFAAYADGMLEEKEFFIRKAIGWALREYGKREPEEVAAWLEPRLARAAGLTVREACKRLPDATREALLEARRAAAG